MPTTPTKTPTKEGNFNFNFASIFASDEMPAEEFKDYLNEMDNSIPKSEGKTYMSLDEALQEKFDLNEYSTLTQRLKNVPS